MKHHIKKQLKLFTVLLMLLVPAFAWGQEWKIDANHSAIGFGVKHIFSTVWGHFSEYDGTIQFDPNALDQSRFDFTVKVKSINTQNGKRDNHLRSKDFFAADKFPVMGFTSSKITHKEGKHYIVTGTLQLKETRKEMQIPFVFHGTAPSPFNKDQVVAGFDTDFVINRLDFGVGNGKFKKMGVVDEMVRIMITIEAIGKK
jgi:polyisoprenoid-binding protein YceI